MDWDAVTRVVAAISAPALASIPFLNRSRRIRGHIRDNLEILERVEQNALLRQHTASAGWLVGKIAVDIARITDQPLGPRKKPINKGSMVLAIVFALTFGYWTYVISRDGWSWWAILPGTLAALMLISVLGMLTNREIPDDPNLPRSAIPATFVTSADRIATAAQFAASGADTTMVAEGGQASVAQAFVESLRDGDFEGAVEYAEENWLRCRIQSRLWNMHLEQALAADILDPLTESLIDSREPADFWAGFAQAEGAQFAEAYAPFESRRIGVASRRRRIARDYDLVILALLPESGEGYMVTEPTALANAVTLLMHKADGRWRVANHVGVAPPVPGFPPTWWAPGDTAFQDLEES